MKKIVNSLLNLKRNQAISIDLNESCDRTVFGSELQMISLEKQWYSYLGRLLVLEYKDERNNRPKDFLIFIIPNLIGCGYIFYKCIL